MNSTRVLRLVEQIEYMTNMMFHEFSPELHAKMILVLDRKAKASFLINTLTKIIDDLEATK
jgi:hypothetical protein